MTQPNHTDTIAAIIAELESIYSTPQSERFRTAFVMLADVMRRLDALDQQSANRTAALVEAIAKQDEQIKAMRMEIDAIERHTLGEAYDRIAALETETRRIADNMVFEKGLAVLLATIEAQEKRLAEIEAWRETMTGDGR